MKRKGQEMQPEAWFIKNIKQDGKNKFKYIKIYSHHHIKVIIMSKD